MAINEKCENCRFWRKPGQFDYDGNGLCKRYPPEDGVFERTGAACWCGEWQPSTPATWITKDPP